MPFRYNIESNGYIVRVVGTDQGSLEAAKDTFARFINDPHLQRPLGLLIDVRALNNIPSREESEGLSKFAKVGDNVQHFTALLVNEGLQYGIARMIQLFSELRGAQINVFIDEHAALYWLWEQLAFAAKSMSTDVDQ
jgi:hypothetical protein